MTSKRVLTKKLIQKGVDNTYSDSTRKLNAAADCLERESRHASNGRWWLVVPQWVYIVMAVFVITAIGSSIGCVHLYNENDKLLDEEWMYRKVRTYFNTEELQKELVNIECDFYRGSWQERDSIKDNIRWREQRYHLDKTFLHFYPTQK